MNAIVICVWIRREIDFHQGQDSPAARDIVDEDSKMHVLKIDR